MLVLQGHPENVLYRVKDNQNVEHVTLRIYTGRYIIIYHASRSRNGALPE